MNVALVGRGGLEPPTSRLSGVRSNHLSYRPSERCGKPGDAPPDPPPDPPPGPLPRDPSPPSGRSAGADAPDRDPDRGPNGGASRDRTGDPLLAKQVLSQLSYGPAASGPPHPGPASGERPLARLPEGICGRSGLQVPPSREACPGLLREPVLLSRPPGPPARCEAPDDGLP
jgi:hypothetical protein